MELRCSYLLLTSSRLPFSPIRPFVAGCFDAAALLHACEPRLACANRRRGRLRVPCPTPTPACWPHAREYGQIWVLRTGTTLAQTALVAWEVLRCCYLGVDVGFILFRWTH